MFETFSRDSLLPQTGRIHLIIDSDAKNSVDDQFAIAWAARSKERFSLDAVYAAPFSFECYRQFDEKRLASQGLFKPARIPAGPAVGMQQSYEEIKKLFELMGEPWEGKVFRGSETYLPAYGVPVESAAAENLIRRVKSSNDTTYIAAIGAATNIASAILMDPSIMDKIAVVWLGGNALGYGQGIEFNLIQDVYAAQTLFDSGVPLVWIPCLNVASLLSVSGPELLERLAGTTRIGDYLAKTVLNTFQDPLREITFMDLDRGSSLLGNCDEDESYLKKFPTHSMAWSKVVWDIAAIAFLKNPNWTPSMRIPSPVLRRDFKWEASPDRRHHIRAVTHCYRNTILGDLFQSLAEEPSASVYP